MCNETKRQEVLKERGIDIASLPVELFAGSPEPEGDGRHYRVYGWYFGRCICVVFRPYGKQAVFIKTAYPQKRKMCA